MGVQPSVYSAVKYYRGLPGGSDYKESNCNVEDLVQSLGKGDPLEEEIATHSNILAWEISWAKESGGL